MKLEQAEELGKKHLEGADTVCVTSDGGVYVNNNIEQMRGHAKANKLDIFVLKDEGKAKAAPKKEKSKKNK